MTVTSRRFLSALVVLIALLGAGAAPAEEAKELKQFIYVLQLDPRLHDEAAWTEADNEAVAEHVRHLEAATEAGTVILAGRTTEPLDRTFGIVVFEAANEVAAGAFVAADPAVAAGVMTATLHPYSVAFMRK